MKRHTHFLLTMLLCGAAGQAMAQAAPGALPAWDDLTPSQRETLVAPIRERWDARPGDRARMLNHAQRWKSMTPEQRNRARHGVDRFQHMSPGQRAEARLLFQHMRALSPAERATLRAKLKAMTPEQRRAWLQAHPRPGKAGPTGRTRGGLDGERVRAESSGR